MTRGYERRTKHRFDSGGANQNESGSSRTNVVSGRELRPRERKRAATADIVKKVKVDPPVMMMMWWTPFIGLSKGVGRLQQMRTTVRKKKKLLEMMRKKWKVRKGKKISLIQLYRGLYDMAQENMLIILEKG